MRISDGVQTCALPISHGALLRRWFATYARLDDAGVTMFPLRAREPRDRWRIRWVFPMQGHAMLEERQTTIESAPLQRDAAPEDARPGRREAEAAVRTLIRWAGDHPSREGLADTPARVVRAYEEWFGGYALDPEQILGRPFEGAGYDDIVLLRDIPLRSTCEHHMAPIRGVAHVAYLPGAPRGGNAKPRKRVDAYARRLQ